MMAQKKNKKKAMPETNEANERYYYWSEEGAPDMEPAAPKRGTYFDQHPHRDVQEAQNERLKGTPVDARSRYLYYSEGSMPPSMYAPLGRYDARRAGRPRAQDRTSYGQYDARHSSVYGALDKRALYDNEYTAVSDAYARYLRSEGRGDGAYVNTVDGGRPQGRKDAYDDYYDHLDYDAVHATTYDSAYDAYDRYFDENSGWQWTDSYDTDLEKEYKNREEDSFQFTEKVLAKIAAQAVQDVEGVLAMCGNMNRCSLDGDMDVSAYVRQNNVVVDVKVVLAYGLNGLEALKKVRQNIHDQIKAMTGMSVEAVHIDVVDIMPREDFYARYDSQAGEIPGKKEQ